MELRDTVDPEILARSAAYSLDRNRARLFSVVLFRSLPIIALWSGLAGGYARAVQALTSSFVLQAVVYVLGIGAAISLLSLPLRLYQTFVIEARHGFNRTSLGLFAADSSKGLVLSGLFTALVVAAAAWLVTAFPNQWWLLVWVFLASFGVLVTLLAPHVIEPLFFKVRPLAFPALERDVHALAERAGVRVGRIFEMDASRRSAHSNAYFTGLGPVKRVVLFDTLLARMNEPEILAVLAHELGHWKRRHLIQRFVLGQLLLLVNCYAVFRLLDAPWLPSLIGESTASPLLRATIIFYAGSLLGFVTTPLFSAWSRRHEWQADEYAHELLGTSTALASGLAKLARDNLANLHPHPWFVAFYASHPTVLERVRRLRRAAEVRPGPFLPSRSIP
jgi:STE24 endopeptidase